VHDLASIDPSRSDSTRSSCCSFTCIVGIEL
jgi:hypothetical protein